MRVNLLEGEEDGCRDGWFDGTWDGCIEGCPVGKSKQMLMNKRMKVNRARDQNRTNE